MNEKRSKVSLVNVLLVVLLLVVIGTVIIVAVGINRTISAVFSPISSANQALSTQISRLLEPTPTIIPDPVTIIREIQSLARLETIQYTVEKVITAEINQGVFGPLFGDKLLLVAHGYVIAGVDLSKIGAEDISIEGDRLLVSLPEAEVFVATLTNEESYVYDRTTGFFQKGNPDLETEARIAAEQEIRKAALEDGILDQAQLNAEIYLERLFNSLGYPVVIFN